MCDAHGRSVCAVSGAERVVDEQITVCRELARVLGIVGRLARLETGVFQQADAVVGHEFSQPLLDRL